MKQALTVLVVAGLAFGCGGDDSPSSTGKTDGGLDGGPSKDGSTPNPDGSSASAKVTDVGASCSGDSACTGGSAAICQTTSFTKFPNPGGSCTAVCTADAECGPNGICPTGLALANFPPSLTAALGTTGYCSQACSMSDATSCRSGYSCVTLNYLAAATGGMMIHNASFPFLDAPFCIPTIPMDGGAPSSHDGGSVADASGIDSAVR